MTFYDREPSGVRIESPLRKDCALYSAIQGADVHDFDSLVTEVSRRYSGVISNEDFSYDKGWRRFNETELKSIDSALKLDKSKQHAPRATP